jgi:D-xylulose reductase
MHALYKVGRMQGNYNVVVTGAGPVGLLGMAAAKALSARRIIAVEANPQRLAFAKSYAATDVYAPPAKNEGETNLQYSERAAVDMKEQLNISDSGPEAIDLVLECSGQLFSRVLGV